MLSSSVVAGTSDACLNKSDPLVHFQNKRQRRHTGGVSPSKLKPIAQLFSGAQCFIHQQFQISFLIRVVSEHLSGFLIQCIDLSCDRYINIQLNLYKKNVAIKFLFKNTIYKISLPLEYKHIYDPKYRV